MGTGDALASMTGTHSTAPVTQAGLARAVTPPQLRRQRPRRQHLVEQTRAAMLTTTSAMTARKGVHSTALAVRSRATRAMPRKELCDVLSSDAPILAGTDTADCSGGSEQPAPTPTVSFPYESLPPPRTNHSHPPVQITRTLPCKSLPPWYHDMLGWSAGG